MYADGGVRYGADILRLLALGVKAVGIGRPIMFANIYGEEGVRKAITLMKREVAIDAGNLGVPDLKKINPSYVSTSLNLDFRNNDGMWLLTVNAYRSTGSQTTGKDRLWYKFDFSPIVTRNTSAKPIIILDGWHLPFSGQMLIF